MHPISRGNGAGFAQATAANARYRYLNEKTLSQTRESYSNGYANKYSSENPRKHAAIQTNINELQRLTDNLEHLSWLQDVVESQIQSFEKITHCLESPLQMLEQIPSAAPEVLDTAYNTFNSAIESLVSLVNDKNVDKNVYMFSGASGIQPYTIVKLVETYENRTANHIVAFNYKGKTTSSPKQLIGGGAIDYQLIGSVPTRSVQSGVFQDPSQGVDLLGDLIKLRDLVWRRHTIGNRLIQLSDALRADYACFKRAQAGRATLAHQIDIGIENYQQAQERVKNSISDMREVDPVKLAEAVAIGGAQQRVLQTVGKSLYQGIDRR